MTPKEKAAYQHAYLALSDWYRNRAPFVIGEPVARSYVRKRVPKERAA